MAYKTNEYTELYRDGEKVMTIYPGKEFNSIPGGCMVKCYAQIKDESGKVILVLRPEDPSTTLRAKQSFDELTVKELKELATERGKKFPSRATTAKLIEILEA